MKYRIVRDNFSGYEVQYKRWWWPWWLQASRQGGWGTNTNGSIDAAKKLVEEHKRGGAVWEA